MEHGVRILSVSPGAVQTGRIEALLRTKAAQLPEKFAPATCRHGAGGRQSGGVSGVG